MTEAEIRTSKRAEWRRFWPLVIAACVGFSFMSFVTAALGVFMDPLTHEFGWSRTQLSLGIALASALSILLSPFVGLTIDRFGVRPLALPGIVLTGLAIAAFSFANGSIAQWIWLWVAWGVFSLLIQSTVWSAAVAGVFKAGRGLALGVTMSGTALAQIVAPPLANRLIEVFGWRGAYVWLGLGWGALAFGLALFFLIDAHELNARRTAREASLATDKVVLSGLTIAQAWRSVALWKVAIATFLILTITIAVVVHQFPILVAAGVSRSDAAWLASLAGVAGIVGKLFTGALVDRFHARWIGAITLASTAIAYPLLTNLVHSPILIAVGIIISGYAAGTKIQLCSYLTARYGGMRFYGTIFGFMTSMISLASVVGPLLAGVSHDMLGSYTPLLLVGSVISVISGLLVLSLGRYPVWPAEQDA